MKDAILSAFRFVQYEIVQGGRSCERGSRRPGRVVAAILAIGLMLPIGPALAGEQVLEIPRVTSVPTKTSTSSKPSGAEYSGRAEYGNATADSGVESTVEATIRPHPPDRAASNEKYYPPDPNVGSISDYENQQGENAQPAGIAFGRRSRRNEPRASMTTNLIVGGLMVGLEALEIASHHHHR